MSGHLNRRARKEITDPYEPTIYVAKTVYEKIIKQRSIRVTNTYVKQGKLFIEFIHRNGDGGGLVTLNNIGPAPQKGEM